MRTFQRKGFPLLYAKTMLFIGNDQRQITILYLFLNKCMSSHYQSRLIRFQYCIGCPTFFYSHGSGQQNYRDFDAIGFQKMCQFFIMLLRQHLRRCHECRLITIMCHFQHCQESHNCLTRPNISLYQPLHNAGFPQIRTNLCHCPLLCTCQFIRKMIHQIFHKRIFCKSKFIF